MPTCAVGCLACDTESLYLRTDGAEGRRSYRSPLARRRDTLAFVHTTIEAALELPGQNPE